MVHLRRHRAHTRTGCALHADFHVLATEFFQFLKSFQRDSLVDNRQSHDILTDDVSKGQSGLTLWQPPEIVQFTWRRRITRLRGQFIYWPSTGVILVPKERKAPGCSRFRGMHLTLPQYCLTNSLREYKQEFFIYFTDNSTTQEREKALKYCAKSTYLIINYRYLAYFVISGQLLNTTQN